MSRVPTHNGLAPNPDRDSSFFDAPPQNSAFILPPTIIKPSNPTSSYILSTSSQRSYVARFIQLRQPLLLFAKIFESRFAQPHSPPGKQRDTAHHQRISQPPLHRAFEVPINSSSIATALLPRTADPNEFVRQPTIQFSSKPNPNSRCLPDSISLLMRSSPPPVALQALEATEVVVFLAPVKPASPLPSHPLAASRRPPRMLEVAQRLFQPDRVEDVKAEFL